MTQQDIIDRIKALGLPDEELKEFLRGLVSKLWPSLPVHSKLKAPYIAEEQQANVAGGVLPVFKENGVWKALVLKAGNHYQGPDYAADPAIPTFIITGGFTNLSYIEGSNFVPEDLDHGEDARQGAAREIEEELVDDQGQPILPMDPNRLILKDNKTVTLPNNARHFNVGMMVELTPQEVKKLRAHVDRLASDTVYRHAVREHTKNKATNRPEACTAVILPLQDIAAGKHTLLYPDQKSLFGIINEHCNGESLRK